MKKIIISLLLFLATFGVQAQTLTLDSCQRLARQNHPLLRQAGVIEQIHSLQRKSLNASNFPQIILNGRATYQSDVTKVDIDFSKLQFQVAGMSNIPVKITMPPDAFPQMAKDQYNIYLEIKQKIYDFGLNRKRKSVSKIDMEIDLQQNEVELYKIRESVNALYFAVLALQENRKILELKQQILDEHLQIAASGVKNGMLLPNEYDNLQAEILLTNQQVLEVDINRQTNVDLLGILIGKELENEMIKFEETAGNLSFAQENKRPEMRLFELQKNKIDQSRKLLNNTYYPYLYAFGQGGFGRPALNMLDDKFAPYYMVGVGFQWTLWDGSQAHYDRKKLLLQKQNVDFMRENFERSLRLSTQKEKNEIEKLQKLLTIDEDVVALKGKIEQRSASALKNGASTSADYIRDLNAFLQAQAMQNIHRLQLIQAKINYQNVLGN